ncbi:MAG: hypothetical protein H6733_15990 [Alphaproteobacteria bacterium]|nr:hypothetical protein [Alphaproteobacteria bacterium]
MLRKTTWLLFVPLLAAAEGTAPLELPAHLQIPAAGPEAALTPETEVVFTTTFVRPSSKFIVVGEDRPKDRLPEAGTPCACDDPNLSCAVTQSGARVGWAGTWKDWPLASGELGTCTTDGAVFPVTVDLGPRKPIPWWRGRHELVAPVAAGTWSKDARVLVDVPHHHLAAKEGAVTCAYDDDTRIVTATVQPGAGPGVYPCLSWDDAGITVRVVRD